jgi:hypothetical protein
MKWYLYTIEMFNPESKEWIKENRYYRVQKNLDDFDLHDVSGKRRNVKFINTIVKW